ncbi:cryptochrome/photolyase family protein [Shewanella woodyi]|uniref:Deoxyribodipyrimidine photolyase-related protein n=1 Tax=Shewanella woodyi (strain ATCC 51908 / MS32) TaxID=392500 RepID=B1KFL2_SHEWM|nr:cryptochrome/photolyase family protein [Shewanella woodyi]ACA88187.1 deoxyribodipyrimidine photolyase-related protein [Shewanella woodyi ATCC 51908]
MSLLGSQPTQKLRLILGDQLNAEHSWYKDKSPNTLYLIAELYQETNYTRHHIQKVSAFFAAMAAFANALEQAGHSVLHLTLDETAQYQDLPTLLNELIDRHQIEEFEYQLPDEYRLRQQLSLFSRSIDISVKTYESEHFYLSDAELVDYFKVGKKHRLEPFYRKLRARFNLLMEQGSPLGGKWNFDADNRQKIKVTDFYDVPTPLLFANDVSTILQRVERHNVATIGVVQANLLWPITRHQANKLLEHFCRYCLVRFGQFQDAMTAKLDLKLGALSEDRQWTLYHSRLSFALNAKLLSPKHVIDTAITAYQAAKGEITLAQIEGFVRQILGWREFVRGVYWANMPEYAELNRLSATRALPTWFWSGDTKMNCLHHAIKQSLEYSYAHHIQRLMVTGNFCLISGVAPDQVDDWYLGVYIDAIEWVEMPNTRGMSQFADGGIVGSKAYAASGNYINKMSDYCTNCHYQVKQSHTNKACPLNALYWRFMAQHFDDFSTNPRTKMVYANWLKKPVEDRELILSHAENLLCHIEEL